MNGSVGNRRIYRLAGPVLSVTYMLSCPVRRRRIYFKKPVTSMFQRQGEAQPYLVEPLFRLLDSVIAAPLSVVGAKRQPNFAAVKGLSVPGTAGQDFRPTLQGPKASENWS